eukprot:14077943-Ditylum_brightwellii.AAC.1
MEYQRRGVESLLCKDLIQWTKASKNLWRKDKAEDFTLTKPAGKKKFCCDMHGRNRTHDTEDFFELKRHAKRAKPNTSCTEVDK